MKVTIYRDSCGVPAWATVTGANPERDADLIKRLRDELRAGQIVFGFDDIEVEVV